MRALHDAAMARAESTWDAAHVHELGDVPPKPALPYLVVSVDAGREESRRLSGGSGSDAHRLVAMAVGQTAAQVGFAVDKAKAAFKDHALVAADYDTTPNVGESSGPLTRDPDGSGLLSLTLVYTFNAYPA